MPSDLLRDDAPYFRVAVARVIVTGLAAAHERDPMSQRFSYVRYDETRARIQANFKAQFEDLERAIEFLPRGRPQALAFTHLEEAYMWVGKALRDEQIQVDGAVLEEPRRGEVTP